MNRGEPRYAAGTMAVYVLVHGAFEGGWVWSRVARALRRAGHDVFTPTLTGCGERWHLLTREVGLDLHVQDVSSVLENESLTGVVLVGHSYAGAVITGVADRAPGRVARLVYLDASVPCDGQSASGSFTEGTAEKLAELSAGDRWLLPPLPIAAVGVTAPDDVARLERLRHPHPMRTLLEPLRLANGDTKLPRTYVRCTQHEGLVAALCVDPLETYVDRARREGWELRELAAPHDAMLTHPEEVAALLLSYA